MLSQAVVTQNPSGFLSEFWRLTYGNPIYSYTLLGSTPRELLGTPPELLNGDASVGQAILAGLLPFQGRRCNFVSFRDLANQANEQWLALIHSFKWLSDLHSVGSSDASTRGQELIAQWMDIYNKWDEFCWRPDILGARLANWTTHFAFLSATANQQFLNKSLFELGRQSRHLSRSVLRGPPGHPRITALKGLIYAGISLPQSEKYLVLGMDGLENQLACQLYPDGGHVSRNPKIQMDFLRDLLGIRAALLTAYFIAPNWLNQAISRMASMLQGMRMGDGGLARFNGAGSEEPREIGKLLSKVKLRGKAPSAYLHSGFYRLETGKTILIMDAGAPPTRGENKWGHAGTLSFELSVGRERLIVNCGATNFMGEDWRQVLRSTAAHSTVSVDDVNSSELSTPGEFNRKPINVHCSRKEIRGKAVIEARSSGYSEIFDLIHQRIIMMSPDGSEILGEDLFDGSGGRKYVVRFHLHPNVKATVIKHGKAVLLKPRRGSGWKFAANNLPKELEDSIYVDGSVRPRRSHQIVVSGELSGCGASVKWTLTRI